MNKHIKMNKTVNEGIAYIKNYLENSDNICAYTSINVLEAIKYTLELQGIDLDNSLFAKGE